MGEERRERRGGGFFLRSLPVPRQLSSCSIPTRRRQFVLTSLSSSSSSLSAEAAPLTLDSTTFGDASPSDLDDILRSSKFCWGWELESLERMGIGGEEGKGEAWEGKELLEVLGGGEKGGETERESGEKARGRRKEDSDWRQPGLKATDFSPEDDVFHEGREKKSPSL